MRLWLLAFVCALQAARSFAALDETGPMCADCTRDDEDETQCDIAGLKQCNKNQVCQTLARCTSDGIFMKKSCVGSSKVPEGTVNTENPSCNEDGTTCTLFCDASGCNTGTFQQVKDYLTCPEKPTGPLCYTCDGGSGDENNCNSEGTTRCQASQVCVTKLRCQTEGFYLKKSCSGDVPEDVVWNQPNCVTDGLTCSTYCNTDGCNEDNADATKSALGCTEKETGPICYSCEGGIHDNEADCNENGVVQCGKNQICQTVVRCQNDGFFMKKGCTGTKELPEGIAYGEPYAEDDNERASTFCDGDDCNKDNLQMTLDALVCPTKPEGPLCRVCHEVGNEGDCNDAGADERCSAEKVCYAKVVCLRGDPNSVKISKRCISVDDVPEGGMNQITYNPTKTLGEKFCDTDGCNDDAAAVFHGLECPTPPPGITCNYCKSTYDPSDCDAEETCRDGNICWSKVVCKRSLGMLKYTSRCRRASNTLPEAMAPNMYSDVPWRYQRGCTENNCNADVSMLVDAIGECPYDPNAPDEEDDDDDDDDDDDGSDGSGGSGGSGEGETCTAVDGDAACTCTCTCEDTCPTPPPEPQRLPCTAGVAGPNLLTTYDGATFEMTANTKYVASRWRETSDQQCKFQVRVDTETAPDGSIRVSWVGTGFGVHKKKTKFDRNYRISLKQGFIEVRGRGYNPTVLTESGCHHSATGEHPWTFCANIDTPGTFVVRGEVPDLGCWYEVTLIEGDGDLVNDKVWIDSSENYDGELNGMCGDRDGDPANDGDHCPGSTGVVDNDCEDGIHLNNG